VVTVAVLMVFAACGGALQPDRWAVSSGRLYASTTCAYCHKPVQKRLGVWRHVKVT
jgi:4-hydroxybenzoate polyprenyltransferase